MGTNEEDDGGRVLYFDPVDIEACAGCQVWRTFPDGDVQLEGVADPSWGHEQFVDFVRERDRLHGRTGGRYQAKLTTAAGRFGKSHRFRVDPMPESARPAAPATPPAHAGIPESVLGTIVATIDASNRAMLERMRAEGAEREARDRRDATEREAAHRRQLELAEKDAERRRKEDREEHERRMAADRDRAASERAAQDRYHQQTIALMRQAGKAEGATDPISNLMTGMRLYEAIRGGGQQPEQGGSGEDKLLAVLAQKMSGIAAEEPPAPPAGGPQQKAATPSGVRREPAAPRQPHNGRPAAPASDEPPETQELEDLIAALLEFGDASAVSALLVAMLRRGKIARPQIEALATGKLDEWLHYEQPDLDSLHRAAQACLDAVPPA